MSIAQEVAHALSPLIERLVDHERRIGASGTSGKVTDVDPAKGLARIEIGKDSEGNSVKGPWQPYAQTAGGLKLHSPPAVGQTMMIAAPSGDIEQGVLSPLHWSDANQSPSDDGDKHVLTIGGVTISLAGDGLTISVGGTTYSFTSAGSSQIGGFVKHDGVNIGKDHVHEGVESGNNLSGTPI
jgi:hypothetical protein